MRYPDERLQRLAAECYALGFGVGFAAALLCVSLASLILLRG